MPELKVRQEFQQIISLERGIKFEIESDVAGCLGVLIDRDKGANAIILRLGGLANAALDACCYPRQDGGNANPSREVEDDATAYQPTGLLKSLDCA